MSSKPPMVPTDEPWLLIANNDVATAERFPTKPLALDYIDSRRIEGSTAQFKLYAPDSCHEIEVRNSVKWERTNG